MDVTHEALIREWPRLSCWLNEDREGLLVHRRLTEAAQEWEELARDSGAPIPEARCWCRRRSGQQHTGAT